MSLRPQFVGSRRASTLRSSMTGFQATQTTFRTSRHNGMRNAVGAERLLAQVFTDYVASGPPLWRYLARRPGVACQALGAMLRLPALTVDLPAGDEARAVAAILREHPATRRAMLGVAAVLQMPSTPGTFAEGADRSTLRRKKRAALKRGVTICPVTPEDRPAVLALARAHERENEREEYRNPHPQLEDLLDYDLWLAARDETGRPVMLAVIPRAGEWSVLRYFRTLESSAASSDARYLMTDALAETLGRLGVRYLVDSARPHWLPNGLRHFQRMVGFRLVRIRSIRLRRS